MLPAQEFSDAQLRLLSVALLVWCLQLGRAMFKKAGELKAPVGFMCMHGLLPLLPAIKALMANSPETPVIFDHFGFCPMDDQQSESWQALLSLASYPQVSLPQYSFRDAVKLCA